MHILDPNWAIAFALATAIARHVPPPLAAIEAGRTMRMSSWSFLSSSCSWRTPTLSRRRHPSLEEPPSCREPQPPSAESFAALGEHPHDPLSVLSFSPSRLMHGRALAVVLWQAAHSAMAPPGFPYRAAVGHAGADLQCPSMDQRPGLEPEDTPSHFKSWSKIWEPTALIYWFCGLVHQPPWTRSIDHGPIPWDFE
jgi:hypothetical protein